METVKVYRIEHSVNHVGPFCNSNGDYKGSPVFEIVFSEIGSKIPSWGNDRISATKDHIAAFTTLDYLFYFFGDVIDELVDSFGFVINEYIVPVTNVIFGDSGIQVAFIP